MKVLISAYACEPDRGSEPEVGWRWANLLTDHVELHVLTRRSNRNEIEASIQKSPLDSGLRRISFIYYDLSEVWLWLKRRKLLPASVYYVLWQWCASRRFHHFAETFDIVHHLTFCSILCPGFWNLKKARFVVGPVGAPLVNPHYLKLFGWGFWTQWLRGKIIRNFNKFPWLDRIYRSAAAVIPANSETKCLFQEANIPTKTTILDTGVPQLPVHTATEGETASTRTLVYAGQLERRKGIELLLRALSKLPLEIQGNWRLDIYGRGPDRSRLSTMIRRLSLSRNVFIHGYITRNELLQKLGSADAFAFCSVRDTSAGVNLEAMACGLPIVCLAHQGIADITDDSCALRIAPSEIEKTVADLSEAFQSIIHSSLLCREMGAAAKQRALKEFSWESKLPHMLDIYKSSLES